MPSDGTWSPLRLAFSLGLPLRSLLIRLPPRELGLLEPRVTTLPCRSPHLAGRRAVHLTDLHIDRFLPRHDRVLATVAAARPDWIFLTGDLLDFPSGLAPLGRFLARLREVAPLYLTLGNHDHASGVSTEAFRDLARRQDVRLLLNETERLDVGDGRLTITGLDDPSTGRADVTCVPAESDGAFALVLAHSPNVVDLLADGHRTDLILCGHSHGGQWRLPGVRPFWLPPGCAGRPAGEYRHAGHRLYVNRGLGWSLLPIRVNCQPEILVIEWESGP